MFIEFFIRKANAHRVSAILKKEGFVYTEQDVGNFLKGNQKGVRYGNAVLVRNENGLQIKRFIKIVLDGKRMTYKLFRRQVQVTAALHDDANFKSPTMAVIKSSFLPPLPYAIFETRVDGDGFGFMHDTPEFYERFGEQDMRRLVEVMYAFHQSGFNINQNTLKYTQTMPVKLSHYAREFKELLTTKITHKSQDGTNITEKVETLLASYFKIPDVRGCILALLEKNFVYVHSSKSGSGSYLVHADMQIDNVYKHPDGNFELLDFEWVGKSDNPVVAIMYDYGNLRARAWSSPAFQAMLDRVMLAVGTEIYKDEAMVKSALLLGTLRSSLMMSRFHMDFVNTVKKDKRTEADYQAMYPKTLESLKQAIT